MFDSGVGQTQKMILPGTTSVISVPAFGKLAIVSFALMRAALSRIALIPDMAVFPLLVGEIWVHTTAAFGLCILAPKGLKKRL
jgi:hypothetical protein